MEINNTHIYIPSPSTGIGERSTYGGNNNADKGLLKINQSNDGAEILHITHNGGEESTHSNIPSHVSDSVFEESQGEKGSDLNIANKATSVEDDIESPTSPKPTVREDEFTPLNQWSTETIPPNNNETTSEELSNPTSNSPSLSEWDLKKDSGNKIPNKVQQNQKRRRNLRRKRGGDRWQRKLTIINEPRILERTRPP